jgi:hypothetical protein
MDEKQTVSLPLLFLLSLESENLNGWDHLSKSWDNIKTDLKVVCIGFTYVSDRGRDLVTTIYIS